MRLRVGGGVVVTTYPPGLRKASCRDTVPLMRTKQHPPIGWRIPPPLKRQVEDYARRTRRSVVGAAEHLLTLALEAEAERLGDTRHHE